MWLFYSYYEKYSGVLWKWVGTQFHTFWPNESLIREIEVWPMLFVSVMRTARDHPVNLFWYQLVSLKRRSADSIFDASYKFCSLYFRWRLLPSFSSLLYILLGQKKRENGGHEPKSPIIATILSFAILSSSILDGAMVSEEIFAGLLRGSLWCSFFWIYDTEHKTTKSNTMKIHTPCSSVFCITAVITDKHGHRNVWKRIAKVKQRI